MASWLPGGRCKGREVPENRDSSVPGVSNVSPDDLSSQPGIVSVEQQLVVVYTSWV